MMKVLILTSEPITVGQLRDALGSEGDPSEAEVMVIAPALAGSAGQVLDVRRRRSDCARRPAIEDARNTFDADRIVLSTHEDGSQRYREDHDDQEIAERFGRPVDHAVV
jgi:hypothetical protein